MIEHSPFKFPRKKIVTKHLEKALCCSIVSFSYIGLFISQQDWSSVIHGLDGPTPTSSGSQSTKVSVYSRRPENEHYQQQSHLHCEYDGQLSLMYCRLMLLIVMSSESQRRMMAKSKFSAQILSKQNEIILCWGHFNTWTLDACWYHIFTFCTNLKLSKLYQNHFS